MRSIRRTQFEVIFLLQLLVEPGTNVVIRRSEDSSVTIPFEQNFRDLIDPEDSDPNPEDAYCGCGWPDHLVVPKGTTSGMLFDLFVMVSDYRQDRVSTQNVGMNDDVLT